MKRLLVWSMGVGIIVSMTACGSSNKKPAQTLSANTVNLIQASVTATANFEDHPAARPSSTKTVYLTLDPVISLKADKPVQDIVISAVSVTPLQNTESIRLLAPSHVATSDTVDPFFNNALGSAPDITAVKAVSNVTYAGGTQDYPLYADQFGIRQGMIKFRLLISPVGTFDYQSILARDHAFTNNLVLQYTGLKAASLNFVVTFTVQINFQDNSYTTATMSATVDGAQLLQNGQTTVNFGAVGQKF